MMVWPTLRVMGAAFLALESLAGASMRIEAIAKICGCSAVTAHRALRWSRQYLAAPLQFARGPGLWELEPWWSPPRVEFGSRGWSLRVGVEVDLSDIAIVEDLGGTFTYGGVVEGEHICGTGPSEEHCMALINRDVCGRVKRPLQACG